MFEFTKRSLKNLEGVDKRLVEVFTEALKLSQYDFGITEGVRSIERQKELLKEKKTKTLKSYHLTGKALDVIMYDEYGRGTWEEKYYQYLNKIIQELADKKGYTITWGGNWKTLVDCPHFQIEY